MLYLPPANKVCEGYVFTPVCQSFCSRGGSASVYAGIADPPPPPGADTPQGPDTPLGPDTPQDQTPLQQTPPGADTHPTCAVHAGRYGQQAGKKISHSPSHF